MALFGVPKALASDYRASPHANSMAPAARGTLAQTPAEQKRAMRLSDLLGSEQELDSTAMSSFAARPCAVGLMDLVAATEPQPGVFLREAAISTARWWQEAGHCDGIGSGAGTAAHEGMGC